MIVKFIRCNVVQGMRDHFAEAQEKWRDVRTCPGFLGQVGGWSLYKPNLAVIVALWEDAATYLRFMEEKHDEILRRSGQESSMLATEIVVGEQLMPIRGASPTLMRAVDDAEVLRYSDCTVHMGAEKGFVAVQREVWNEGLGSARGMLGGMFARVAPSETHFVVVTLWGSEDDHALYSKTEYPKLAERARPQDHLMMGRGGLVALDRSWLVMP